MFDEVIFAVNDDKGALDALALGSMLASPDGAQRPSVVQDTAPDTAAPAPLMALADVEPHGEYGGRVPELGRYGASVDLLVIGHRDREQGPGLHPGTLAQRLAHRVPCPLLVVAKPVPVPSDDL